MHSMIPPTVAKDPEHVMRMQHEMLEKLAAVFRYALEGARRASGSTPIAG